MGENFHELVKNTIFTEKTFVDCSLLPHQWTSHTQILWRKLFTNSYKTMKFVKVFSLKSFPLYSSYLIAPT